jgi:hypothetical protein
MRVAEIDGWRAAFMAAQAEFDKSCAEDKINVMIVPL